MTIRSMDARVGARIRELRLARGIDMATAAAALGVAADDYALREDGKKPFTAGELAAVAHRLGISFDDVFARMVTAADERASKRQ